MAGKSRLLGMAVDDINCSRPRVRKQVEWSVRKSLAGRYPYMDSFDVKYKGRK
jgi:hypothetical protein